MSCCDVETNHQKRIPHVGGYMGRGGFGILVGLEILKSLHIRYGVLDAQEEDDASARFDLPMNRDDPQKL